MNTISIQDKSKEIEVGDILTLDNPDHDATFILSSMMNNQSDGRIVEHFRAINLKNGKSWTDFSCPNIKTATIGLSLLSKNAKIIVEI